MFMLQYLVLENALEGISYRAAIDWLDELHETLAYKKNVLIPSKKFNRKAKIWKNSYGNSLDPEIWKMN